MDTRTKIVPLAEAARRMSAWRAEGMLVELVRGSFDPLLAGHAAQLEQACTPGARVVVFLAGSGDAILPVLARAELVSALRRVDLVVAEAADVPPGFRVHDFTARDLTHTADFVDLVHRRNRAGQ